MSAYFTLHEKDIILKGKTKRIDEGLKYIVYLDPSTQEIRINTEFRSDEADTYSCCKYYDRMLCRTIEEFNEITMQRIESQAYSSWMDGAR